MSKAFGFNIESALGAAGVLSLSSTDDIIEKL